MVVLYTYALVFFALCVQNSTAAPLVGYIGDPDNFVKTFGDCVRDETCHFYYWHITKTGGKTIERSFRKMFSQPKVKACCYDEVMGPFFENPDFYCRLKFSSYEVFGGQMRRVAETCMKLLPDSRAIMLVTYREPIARFVSNINFVCNKLNVSKLNEEMLRFCRRCVYAPDTAVFVHQMIEEYHNGKYMSIHTITEMDVRNLEVLFLDTMDINSFFEKLKLDLQPDFNLKLQPKNIEKNTACDFSVTSAIVRELAPSTMIYRNITLMYL